MYVWPTPAMTMPLPTSWINLQQYRSSGEILSASGLDAFGEDEMRAFAEQACAFVPTHVRGI